MDELSDLLGGKRIVKNDNWPPYEEQLKDLKKVVKQLNEPRNFEVGDEVEFKPEMDNKLKRPQEIWVVSHIYDEPIKNSETDAGSPYYNEQLDVIVAHYTGDEHNTIVEHHVDSRRLRKVKK